MTRIVRTALFGVLVTFAASVAHAADAAGIESAAREFTRLAYDGQFDRLAGKWGGQAAGRQRFETQIRNALRVRCLYVDGISVTPFENGAHVFAVLSSSDGSLPDMARLTLRFAPTPDGWRVTAVEFPDQALATQLIAAKGDERIALLLANDDVLTRSLVRAIYQRAVQALLQADPKPAEPLAALTRDVAVLAGDRGGESLALGMHGILARLAGRRDEAMRVTRDSLEIAEESGDALALTRAHLNLRLVLSAYDQYSPHLEQHLRLALAASKRVDDPSLELRVMAHLTDLAESRRDLVTTRRYVELIARRIEETGDPTGDVRAQLEVTRAKIYLAQGDYELALHHCGRLARELEGKNSWFESFGNYLCGRALHGLGRKEEARAEFAAGLRRARAINYLQMIFSLTNDFASLVAEQGDLAEAECMLREAGTIGQRTGFTRAGQFDRILPYLLANGQPEHALRLSLEQAATAAAADTDERADALAGAAQAYHALGMRDRAMAAITEATENAEAFQKGVGGREIQYVHSAGKIASMYELAADFALANGDVIQALSFIDRGRGRVLHDLVENGRPDSDHETDRADLEIRLAYERRLAALNIELSKTGAANAATLRSRLAEARREYESFMDGLRARQGRRASTRPREVTPEELARRVPNGVAMVVYVVRDEELHILTARRAASGALDVRRASSRIARKQLEAKVEELAGMMNSGDLRYRGAAQALYTLLVAPVENAIAGAGAVCIVPDECLWRVPFAALMDREGRFLVEKTPVVYAASISVYAAVSAQHDARGRTRSASVLAVANPLVESDAAREVVSVYRDVDLGALPDAEAEAEALCRMYGGARCTVLKRRQATESRTKSEIRNRSLVHFATHGLLDDGNPMYSRLILARGDEATEDGSLEAWEIARLDLEADLVVLSACDTARGQVGGGEGVVGMAWSFFVAGARSALATQWRVESESTADLMIAFHRALREENASLRKARALRTAQLRLLRDPKRRHPFYWAAFVLIGDAS